MKFNEYLNEQLTNLDVITSKFLIKGIELTDENIKKFLIKNGYVKIKFGNTINKKIFNIELTFHPFEFSDDDGDYYGIYEPTKSLLKMNNKSFINKINTLFKS